jgi:C-terminal processing protease CtpA/Prc
MIFQFDAASRAEVLEQLIEKLSDHYVYPEKAALYIAHLRTRQSTGAYDTLEAPQAFCHQLTVDLQEISRDRHLVLLWRPELRGTEETATDADIEVGRRQEAVCNYGFRKVEIRDGNIGLIDIRSFHDPLIAGDTAAAVMRLISNTDALIFDVRNNMGGDGRMVILLCSYLCPGNQWELSGYYSRKVGKLEPSWTMPYVPGPYYTNRPVYVLTGPHSFSAAELLAYDLQALKRATIVGEVTGGAAHGADWHELPHGCDALISYSAPTNPITGGNWEAVGVQPDIQTPEADALNTAHEAALRVIASMI